jgi:carboxypeptidase T
MKFFSLLI